MVRITLDQIREDAGLSESEVWRDNHGMIQCATPDIAEKVRIAMERLFSQQNS